MSSRIVVKVGTKVLTKPDHSLDQGYLVSLVTQIVALREEGIQVILVTSGAVAAGKKFLSPEGKTEVTYRQACAALGQGKLIGVYSSLFEKFDYHCAQALATKGDFRDPEHYLNMQNCFEALLKENIVPIVNENDVVATTELMFTDNDELAGLIAKQMKVKKLIILTSTDGILDGKGNTVPFVAECNLAEVRRHVTNDTSPGGRGGMVSKFNTALELASVGITTHIVDGRQKDVLPAVMNGKISGTVVSPI